MTATAFRAAIAALAGCTAAAQTSPVPGWSFNQNRNGYEAALDRATFHGGAQSAHVRCGARRCPQFATLMQAIHADEFIGYRVRLSAWVKATKGGNPRIWMRIDGAGGEMLAFDNMDNRSKSGPFDWRRQEIVLDVVPPGALVNFGLIVNGNGAAWIDDVVLEAVPANVKSTDMLQGPSPARGDPAGVGKRYDAAKTHPANLDFEEQPAK